MTMTNGHRHRHDHWVGSHRHYPDHRVVGHRHIHDHWVIGHLHPHDHHQLMASCDGASGADVKEGQARLMERQGGTKVHMAKTANLHIRVRVQFNVPIYVHQGPYGKNGIYTMHYALCRISCLQPLLNFGVFTQCIEMIHNVLKVLQNVLKSGVLVIKDSGGHPISKTPSAGRICFRQSIFSLQTLPF